MKARPLGPVFMPVLLAGLALMLAGRAPAQPLTVLYSFNASLPSVSNDGFDPMAGLFLSGNTLYGTTYGGGSFADGVVFAINTDGSSFTNLHSFSGWTQAPGGNPYDGSNPQAGLILSGNTLYGTTVYGGTNLGGSFPGVGVVFAVNTDGSSIGVTTTLRPFSDSDGIEPLAGLVLSGNTLYGTTSGGGTNGNGTVFAVNTENGSDFTVLHSFPDPATPYDGAEPQAGLILSGNTLYGTTSYGGRNGYGTVFRVNTDGTSFTNLHSFADPATPYDGVQPVAGLVLSGSTLYGTTDQGGTNGHGTVFAVNINGSNYMILHSFSDSDGAEPEAALVLSGKTLYGTTLVGGRNAFYSGTVFALNTDGSGFTTLYNFTNGVDGYGPNGLVLSGNTLYGTTQRGGTNVDDDGTVFKLVVPITLFYQHSGSATVLSWNDPSFALQAAPAVTGTYTNIPSATSPYTNTITGPQQFFRLLVSQ
jgi:uncharacterized repeat protein (TIGR03803 family)